MSALREAAQQALEALEAMTRHFSSARLGESTLADSTTRGEAHAAMNNLRAALAEPVQEPVAWIQPDHLQKARQAPFLCRVEPTKRMVDFVALYTAPPQRKPLTDEQISNRLWESDWPELLLSAFVKAKLRAFARAIERAHGIGEGA